MTTKKTQFSVVWEPVGWDEPHTSLSAGGGRIGAQAERVPRQEEPGGKKGKETNQQEERHKGHRHLIPCFSHLSFGIPEVGMRGPVLQRTHGGTGEKGIVTTIISSEFT